MPLADLINVSLSASTIPTGILLVLCAYDTSLIQDFKGLGVFLALAGLTFLYTIINRIKSVLIKANKPEQVDRALNSQQKNLVDDLLKNTPEKITKEKAEGDS